MEQDKEAKRLKKKAYDHERYLRKKAEYNLRAENWRRMNPRKHIENNKRYYQRVTKPKLLAKKQAQQRAGEKGE